MGFMNLEFFNCEPFELNFRLYSLGGFWPIETKVRWKQILYSMFSYLCNFSMISLVAISVMDLYLVRHDFLKLTKNLCSTSVSFAICLQHNLVFSKINLVNELREEMTVWKNSRTDPEDIEILEASNTKIVMVIRFLYFITSLCVIFWILYPLLDTTGALEVPVPYRLPIDEWSPTVFALVYLYLAVTMVNFMICVLSLDGIYCSFILRINAQYDIIIKNLKKLKSTYDSYEFHMMTESERAEKKALENENAMKILRENIKLHKTTLRHIRIVEKIYGNPVFVHFVAAITCIGVILIDMLMISKRFKFQILQRLMYLAISLSDTFLYCFFGSLIQQKSMDLSLAVYETPWYEMDPKLRKCFLFITQKAQRVPKIMGQNLISFEIKTFLGLMKTSYDLTALLYHTTKK